MVEQIFRKLLFACISDMGASVDSIHFDHPVNPEHGEYASPVAMTLAKQLHESPLAIGQQIRDRFIEKAGKISLYEIYTNTSLVDINISGTIAADLKLSDIIDVEIVPPGFLNIHLRDIAYIIVLARVLGAVNILPTVSDQSLERANPYGWGSATDTQCLLIEFAQANPFKEFHIGHLRNIILGESFSRLKQAIGVTVKRVNYEGDVGLHVAKALWGMEKQGGLEAFKKINDLVGQGKFLGQSYALGAQAYEDDAETKSAILVLNKLVYQHDPLIMPLYQAGREASLAIFDQLYQRVGTTFDRLYFESETAPLGKALVTEHIADGVFEKSDGAVIYRGEQDGLHTRVFITKEDNPTYEAKDLALAALKYKEYHFDHSIVMTGNEQSSYFSVMLAALKHIHPDIASKYEHVSYGMVNLKDGKMSSRTGHVLTADWLINQAKQAIAIILSKNDSKYDKKEQEFIAEKAALAAVKHSMLKVSSSSDMSFDLASSVSFEGDSGPYLQYTYARCQSVLRKRVGDNDASFFDEHVILSLQERLIVRSLLYFPEVVREAAETCMPHLVCTYLFLLAQQFNTFYAEEQILLTDPDKKTLMQLRVAITQATGIVLRNGLFLLGIDVLESM